MVKRDHNPLSFSFLSLNGCFDSEISEDGFLIQNIHMGIPFIANSTKRYQFWFLFFFGRFFFLFMCLYLVLLLVSKFWVSYNLYIDVIARYNLK